MKIRLTVFFIFGLFVSVAVNAGQVEYDDCILKHLQGAKFDVATHFIIEACKENYKSSGIASEKKKAYSKCILENMVGIESLQAVMAINEACSNKFK